VGTMPATATRDLWLTLSPPPPAMGGVGKALLSGTADGEPPKKGANSRPGALEPSAVGLTNCRAASAGCASADCVACKAAEEAHVHASRHKSPESSNTWGPCSTRSSECVVDHLIKRIAWADKRQTQ
jgi:hypothetical protein